MSPSAARRRYYLRLAAFFALYMAVLIPVIWAFNSGHWPGRPWNYLAAAAPAVPVFGVIWAILRYVIEEEDEFLRLLHLRATVGATGLTLAICSLWGFLSSFAGVPPASLMYVFVIFCMSLMPALAWTHWRAR
jgi:hypothetical protein